MIQSHWYMRVTSSELVSHRFRVSRIQRVRLNLATGNVILIGTPGMEMPVVAIVDNAGDATYHNVNGVGVLAHFDSVEVPIHALVDRGAAPRAAIAAVRAGDSSYFAEGAPDTPASSGGGATPTTPADADWDDLVASPDAWPPRRTGPPAARPPRARRAPAPPAGPPIPAAPNQMRWALRTLSPDLAEFTRTMRELDEQMHAVTFDSTTTSGGPFVPGASGQPESSPTVPTPSTVQPTSNYIITSYFNMPTRSSE